MHKNKNIPIALALTGVLTAVTAGYINNIKSDLSTANAQIELTVDMDGTLVRELTSAVEKNGKNEIRIKHNG